MSEDVVSAKIFNQVAQAGHFAGGLATIWGSVALFHVHRLFFPALIFAVVTGLKEFWYDQHYESEIVRGSNLQDWAFYQLGSMVATLWMQISWMVSDPVSSKTWVSVKDLCFVLMP